jgi:hypothetical protein
MSRKRSFKRAIMEKSLCFKPLSPKDGANLSLI